MKYSMATTKGIVVASIITVGFSAIIVKATSMEPSVLMFWRMCFAVLFFGLVAAIKDKGKSLIAVSKKEALTTMGVGIFFSLQAILYVYAIKNTSIAHALILINSASIYTVLLAKFVLKEKISNKAVGYVIFAFIGCIVLSLSQSGSGISTSFGNLCAWLGAIFFAIYLIGAKKQSATEAPLQVKMVFMWAGGAIFFFIVNLVTDQSMMGYPLKEYGLAVATAFAGIIIPQGASNWAMKKVNAAFIATIFLIEPIAGAAFAFLIFHETLGVGQLIGGAMVIFGLICYNLYEVQKETVGSKR